MAVSKDHDKADLVSTDEDEIVIKKGAAKPAYVKVANPKPRGRKKGEKMKPNPLHLASDESSESSSSEENTSGEEFEDPSDADSSDVSESDSSTVGDTTDDDSSVDEDAKRKKKRGKRPKNGTPSAPKPAKMTKKTLSKFLEKLAVVDEKADHDTLKALGFSKKEMDILQKNKLTNMDRLENLPKMKAFSLGIRAGVLVDMFRYTAVDEWETKRTKKQLNKLLIKMEDADEESAIDTLNQIGFSDAEIAIMEKNKLTNLDRLRHLPSEIAFALKIRPGAMVDLLRFTQGVQNKMAKKLSKAFLATLVDADEESAFDTLKTLGFSKSEMDTMEENKLTNLDRLKYLPADVAFGLNVRSGVIVDFVRYFEKKR